MRITDHRIVDLSAAATQRNQSKVADLANQVSTGMRVSKPSEDPTAWLTAQRARVQAALNDGTNQAIQLGHERMVSTDGAVATLSGIVSQARELAVEGANDTQTASSRASIGAEMQSLFDAAVSTANTRDPSGEYLLAGTASTTQPFDPATGAYAGNSTARGVSTDTNSSTLGTVPGSKLTAASGVDILPMLKALADALNTNNTAAIRSSLGDLDTAVKQLAQTRGETGGHMAALESAKNAHEQLAARISDTISNAVEVDTVAAASDLAKASSALTVSQTVTAHVLQLLDPTK
jgi:flagellar hook-associated protein 3 FlgL